MTDCYEPFSFSDEMLDRRRMGLPLLADIVGTSVSPRSRLPGNSDLTAAKSCKGEYGRSRVAPSAS
jgi:hypothetical protein